MTFVITDPWSNERENSLKTNSQKKLKKLKFEFPDVSTSIQKLRLGSVVPKELDLHGAAQALIRLQDVYELDIAEIAGGKIGQSRSAARLSAQDCLFIGKHCFNGGVLARSIEWFEEAWMLAGEERNKSVSQDQVQQFLDHAAKEHDERVMAGESSGNLFPRPVYEEPPQEQRAKLVQSLRERPGMRVWGLYAFMRVFYA